MNKSLFLKVICYFLILFQFETFTAAIVTFCLHNTPSPVYYNSISYLIQLLSTYSNFHLIGIVLVGVSKLFIILSAIICLRKLSTGRKMMIISFYILITNYFFEIIRDANMGYLCFTHLNNDNSFALLIISYSMFCILSAIYIALFIWLIKQLRTEEIKNLFIK